MFRFTKPKDVITLFHKPSLAPSMRVLALLKQSSAEATETATIDQASDHSAQSANVSQRSEFDLDVSEEAPTADQLRNILEYTGGDKASSIVEGATDVTDAIKRLKEDRRRFKFPVTVDWNNGKAVIGDKESEILKMVRESKS